MTWYREDANGVTFAVRVVPRASRSEVVGLHDGALRIRIAAPPVEGAANRELVKFLAQRFKVAQAAITLISGASSKSKIIRIANFDAAMREQLEKLI
jgi:uncharacterized protein (TIGR00251 family)